MSCRYAVKQGEQKYSRDLGLSSRERCYESLTPPGSLASCTRIGSPRAAHFTFASTGLCQEQAPDCLDFQPPKPWVSVPPVFCYERCLPQTARISCSFYIMSVTSQLSQTCTRFSLHNSRGSHTLVYAYIQMWQHLLKLNNNIAKW